MNTDPSTPANDANLSALGRELLETGSSKPSGPWVPPTAEELHQLLPEYDIVKMLGRGGMGAVYMGRQTSLDRPVAIKILSTALEDADPSFAERFKNEARSMGRLSHPCIVGAHDFGETAGGLLYIVMEYVEGTDVAKMIAKQGRLHTDHAMAITAHVCDALGYAHDRGIIHRDIKPANIMVGYDGVVKVADFGLAKMTQGNASGLTQSGMAMGTLHYMAPEALMLGSGVDHRADIYAVGVMLYQMLTGKIPQGMFELPSLQVPGLDPRYDGIIAKALREDRDKRYQSVGEMRADLDGILTQPVIHVVEGAAEAPAALPTQARPQRPGGKAYRPPQSVVHRSQPAAKSSSFGLVWLMVAVVIMGIGAYVFFGGTADRSQDEQTKNTTAPDRTALSSGTLAASLPAVSKVIPTPPPTPSVVLSDVWTELTDGKTFNGWEQWGTAEWSADDGALSAANGGNGLLHRQLPSPWFELTGEVLVSAQGNGGIMFHFTDPEKPNAGFELQLAGSIAKRNPVGNGGLFTYGKGDEDIVAPAGVLADNTFGKFRLLVQPDRIQAWIGDRQTVDYQGTLNPPAKGNLAISRWGPDGKASYRNLRWRVSKDAADIGAAAGNPAITTPPSTAPAFNLQQLLDFRLRVANYQKARHAQLSGLSGKYRNALNSTRAEATKGGVLADVTALDDAITRATALADEIEKNLTSLEVKPLSALPELSPTVPQRLKDLRAIFERETAKIETTLVASLDQSLATVQTSLTQAANLPAAKAVEDYRKQMIAAFKNTNTVPVAAAPAQPSSTASPLLQATKDQPFVNSLGMKFVPVPDTDVLFCIHEVRYQDYAIYAVEAPSVDSGWKDQSADGYTPTDKKEQHAVMKVSWEDAQKFCAWLSKREGKTYRLPTDQEWSYAVGIGRSEKWTKDTTPATVTKNQTDFAWGNYWPPPKGSGNFSDDSRKAKAPNGTAKYLDSYDDSFPTTAPVMNFKPNKLSLYDLEGNVREWVEDWYDNEKTGRGLRGGCWFYGSRSSLLSSCRIYATPVFRSDRIGFRCVLVPDSAPKSADKSGTTFPPPPPTVTPAVQNTSTITTATKDKPFVNSLGMKFVPVPGTKVLMCIHETRRRDFAAFDPKARNNIIFHGLPVNPTDDHPAIALYNEAERFHEWLSQQEQRRYRLPTDREWSIAVGIGDQEDAARPALELSGRLSRRYPWGRDFPPRQTVANIADSLFRQAAATRQQIAGYTDGHAMTAPVMTFPPNELGLYDLAGNLWEACVDDLNPSAPVFVLRGGCFLNSEEEYLNASKRTLAQVGVGTVSAPVPTLGRGFRSVLELP